MFKKYFWLFLVISAFGIGVYGFETMPGFWFDEGIMAQAAKNIAFNGVYGIQTSPGVFYANNFWITTGYPVVFPTALFLKIFGVSVWAARITPFIYLLAFVAVSYFFIKKLYGFVPAAFAGLLLITFPPLYGNGKALLGEVPGLFWFVFGGFLYLLWEEKQENKFLYFAALAWGLSLSTKPYFILIVPGIVFLILFLWLKRGALDWRSILMFSAIFSAPVFIWAYFAFDISSLQNFKATISYFLNSYAAQTFDIWGNLFRFVRESTPIHFSVLALVVFYAFFVSLKNKNQFKPIVVVMLSFAVFVFLWYLKTPGWYRYFFPAHVIVILFFPYFLFMSFNRSVAFVAVASLMVFQTAFLFLNYSNFYGDNVLQLKKYVEENISHASSVFVDSLPEVGFILNNENFYQRIFISKNTEIGAKPSGFNPDYLIVNRSADVDSAYGLVSATGHYRIYKRKTI